MTKPNRFGGWGKFARWGSGSQVAQIPQRVPLTYSDFSGGYNSAPGEEDGPPNSSPNCQDILISKSNRLIRMPGGTAPTALANIMAYEMVVHQSLQNIGELVFFGPPKIAVLSNAGLVVTDIGLPNSDELFRWALYGETLVFTNGRGKVYTREPSSAPVESDSIPMGKTFGVLSSRLFVGGAVIEGEYQPMGMIWNASDVDVQDFSGPGAGNEILISDAAHGDAIIAVRMMNLDLMGILCKQSIWIGRRTQDPYRPAAYEPRIMGVGGLHDRACIVTPLGLTYLSETGLRAFDGNSSIVISAQINNELLPLDFDQINDYRLNYDYKRNWIYLHTPFRTWILDIEYQRWYQMAVSGIVDSVIWKEQLSGTTWDDLLTQGLTWDDLLNSSWSSLGRRESGWGAPLFLRRTPTTPYYWTEVSNSEVWPSLPPAAAVAQVPKWEVRHKEGQYDNTIVTYNAVIIKYAGAGDVRLYLPDNEGKPVPVFRQTLSAPVGGVLRTIKVPLIWSGKGATAALELVSGQLEIAKFQLVVDVRSENPSRADSDMQEYFGFWDTP